MIWTPNCDLLGIEHPILQGGMRWAASAELAAPVPNDDATGIWGAGDSPMDVMRREFRRLRSLTDKPFRANVRLCTAGVEEIVQVWPTEKALASPGASSAVKPSTT